MPKDLSYLLDKKDLKKQPKELRIICEKIFYNGKGLRSQIVSLVSSKLFLKRQEQFFLSRIVEYIHNSSLLHDDFIDHSKTRRSRQTAWLEFSPAQAVLAGDYLLAKVNVYLAQAKNLDLVERTAEAICELAEGEFLQRELFDFKSKDLKKRDRISEFKTGSLFKWCLQAPFIYKNRNSPALHRLLNRIGCSLGLLFQRSDDLIDFGLRDHEGKTRLSDIQQKYFNSFACFLLQGASRKKEQSFQKVKKLSQFYDLFPDFRDSLKSFDQKNYRRIVKTEKDLEDLKPFLTTKEQALILELQKLPKLLYWRNKKSEEEF